MADAPRISDYPIGLSLSPKDGSVSGLFLELDRIIPATQVPITVEPLVTVGEAVKRMSKHRISQVPVVQNNRVLGVFSFRSFTTGFLAMAAQHRPKDVELHPVRDFMEKPIFKSRHEDLGEAIPDLERDDVLLIGDSEKLLGIVTTVDALKVYYGLSSPYVMIAEAEVTVRALITKSVNDAELQEAIAKAIKPTAERQNVPGSLEEMTFNDYAQLVGHSHNWPKFEKAFGGTRELTRSKLDELRVLRNDLFHFRKHMTQDEYDALKAHREWLQVQARTLDALGASV